MTQLLIRLFVRHPDDTKNAAVRTAYGNLASLVGMACNLLLCLGKLAAGTLFGSIAIMADALNNLSDASSNVVSLVGFRLAAKGPDEKHPYGHARYEYLAGLVVCVTILAIGLSLLKESALKVLHPTAVVFSWLSVGVLAASIGVKLWMSRFNKTIGQRINSETLMATAADSRNDVLTTSAVLLSTVLSHLTGWDVLDGLMGVAVAAFILWSGIGIAKDTVAPLLGEAADPVVARNIRRIVMEFDHIVGVHDMIIHNYGAGRSIASLHAEVPSDSDFVAVHEEIDEAEKRVWQQTGVYLVIHMDPIDINNAYVNALREQTDGVLRQIDGQLTMHDFRVVDGKRQINLIFDVVVPFSYDEDAKRDLLMKIYDSLKAIDSRYNPVVTLDHQM